MKRNLPFFIRQPGRPLGSLCIRIRQRWEWEGNWECGWSQTLPERSDFQQDREDCESGKECKTAAEKTEKCCSFCGKRGFSLLPNSTSAANPVQRAAGIRKTLKINHHIKKRWKNKNNSSASALITSASFVFDSFLRRIRLVLLLHRPEIIRGFFLLEPTNQELQKKRAGRGEPITGRSKETIQDEETE